MKPASAKAKGRKLQKWVVAELLRRFPALFPDDVRSCAMGSCGEDVQLSPAARAAIPFSIECKARGGIAVYDWLDQAKTNADRGIPLVIAKADRRQPIVILDAETFFNFAFQRV